nr:unnamed protein product [Callosobruchus analis]
MCGYQCSPQDNYPSPVLSRSLGLVFAFFGVVENTCDNCLDEEITATYVSKHTQNELINCCAQEILDTIVKRVNFAMYCSVMFDETTDISGTSQMSVVLRYMFKDETYDDFVGFVDCLEEEYGQDELIENYEPILSGKAIGSAVDKLLSSLKIDINFLVGIGTDGCSVMTFKQIGAVQKFRN